MFKVPQKPYRFANLYLPIARTSLIVFTKSFFETVLIENKVYIQKLRLSVITRTRTENKKEPPIFLRNLIRTQLGDFKQVSEEF